MHRNCSQSYTNRTRLVINSITWTKHSRELPTCLNTLIFKSTISVSNMFVERWFTDFILAERYVYSLITAIYHAHHMIT